MEIPSDAERVITTVVERPWEATLQQLMQVMAGAEIEKLGFRCRIGGEEFKVELVLTELCEE